MRVMMLFFYSLRRIGVVVGVTAASIVTSIDGVRRRVELACERSSETSKRAEQPIVTSHRPRLCTGIARR